MKRRTNTPKRPNNSQPQSLAYSNAHLETPKAPRISSSRPPACGKCYNRRLLTNQDNHPECPTCGWINYNWLVKSENTVLIDSLRPSVSLLKYSGGTPQWKDLILRLQLAEANERIGVKGRQLFMADCPICLTDKSLRKPRHLTKGLSSKGKYTLMHCTKGNHKIKLIKGKEGEFTSWDS